MKIALRVVALSLFVSAAVAGNSISRNSTVAAIHNSTSSGPIPMCNPWTQNCPPIR
jgi:hypothetical protein